MITQVTFTGIDARTDIRKLVDIQKRYPYVEFGLLVARSRQGKENRYPDLDILQDIGHTHLNLACHVCGSLARDIIHNATRDNFWRNSFVDLEVFLDNQLRLFDRIQMNISGMEDFPDEVFLHTPWTVKELVIQQNPSGKRTYYHTYSNSNMGILYDGSGGRGIESTFEPKRTFAHTGYAGGLKPENILEKIRPLMGKRLFANNRHWIDMESGVRTDDWFDLDKVEEVLHKIDPFIRKTK